MKKVAIMTWFHYYNFGTALQVTASTYTIKKLGFQAEVIRYIPHARLITLPHRENINSYINKLNINKKNIKNQLCLDTVREKAFNEFLNQQIKLTKECKTASDLFKLNSQYDAFVCGSDQIWAPSIFNSKYFLDFVQNPSKMVAYAPSIGVDRIENKHIENCMKENINRFKYLSIREEQGKKIKKYVGKKQK